MDKGRVIFISTTLRVAGDSGCLFYMACLQLSLRVRRSVGRMELEK